MRAAAVFGQADVSGSRGDADVIDQASFAEKYRHSQAHWTEKLLRRLDGLGIDGRLQVVDPRSGNLPR